MSKRVPSAESLLWRCRGEQNGSNQNGYKAAALCVCITGDLLTVFVRVTNEREQSCLIFHSIMFKKQFSNHLYFRKHADTFRIFLTCLCLKDENIARQWFTAELIVFTQKWIFCGLKESFQDKSKRYL